jgi:hypothetical protein
MASFLVLYHKADPPTGESVISEHAELSKWLSQVSNSVLDSGKQISKGMIVTDSGIKTLPPNDAVNNYVILQARNKDEALELTRTAPSIYEGGCAEVYEISEEN